MNKLFGMIAGLLLITTPVKAATVFDGVTYNLTGAYTAADKTSAHFTLDITGINGVADTNGGRFGVNAYAFLLPSGLVTGTSPGFTFMNGGLNSGGCNGSGNFFCFNDNAPKPSTVLPANSSLQFTFDLFLAPGFNLDNYNDSFKIDWLGLKNNYDLISKHLGVTGGITPFDVPSEVPIPGAVWLFGSGLAGLALLQRRRKKNAMAVEAVSA